MAKEFFSVCIPLNVECLREKGICVKKEVCVKEEIEWEAQDDTALAELYADHMVKDELVLGPETILTPDVAFATYSLSDESNRDVLDLCKGTWYKEKISTLRTYIVKLECDLIENMVQKCDICQKTFKDHFNLTTHMKTHEALDINNKCISKRPKTATKTVDKLSLTTFLDHSVKPKLHKFEEIQENKMLSSKMNFTSLSKTHTEEVNEKKNVKSKLKIEKHSEKENHAVKLANRSDLNIKNLYIKDQINSHKTEIQSTTCEICKKSFSCESHLIRHKRLHTGRKPHACEICNKRFAQKDYLLRHEKIHLKQKLYSCEYCYKQFSDNSNYNKHKRFHRGDKRYTCEVCGKRFSQAIHLSSHQLTHTGQKPYSCGTCQKRFTYKHRLIVHERTHSGQKPFGCQLCTKRFVAQCRLSRHGILIHKMRLAFNCDVCQIQFKTKAEITKHMSNSH